MVLLSGARLFFPVAIGSIRAAAGSDRRHLVPAFVIACLVLAGCQVREPESAAVAVAPLFGESAGFPVAVTDRLHRTVEFAGPPDRIVSLFPAMTEILYALGAESSLVGVTDYCNYPPQAQDRQSVGGGVGDSLNREILVDLKPDLVLAKWDTHEQLIRQLEEWRIPVLALGAENLEGMYDEVRILGRVTGRDRAAEELVDRLQTRMNSLLTALRERREPHRVRVFYQVWDDPLMSAGPESFIGQLLTLADAENVLGATAIRYPQVSQEAVFAADPEVIIAPSSHSSPITVDSILNRPGWAQVTAVKTGRVSLIDGDRISRCGPRLPEAFAELIQVLHGIRLAEETDP